MTAIFNALTTMKPLPEIWYAHWLLRLPLALVMFQQGIMKFPFSAEAAVAMGLPPVLWAMSGIGQLLAAAGLVIGGLLRTRIGDVITRMAGFAVAAVVAGVLVVLYAAPIAVMLESNQYHLLLLAGGLFFLLRGNEQRMA